MISKIIEALGQLPERPASKRHFYAESQFKLTRLGIDRAIERFQSSIFQEDEDIEKLKVN